VNVRTIQGPPLGGSERLLSRGNKSKSPLTAGHERGEAVYERFKPARRCLVNHLSAIAEHFAALDTMIRPPNQGAVPSVRKTGSRAAWASEVPAGPGVAPMPL
jgi:hypothetical protein